MVIVINPYAKPKQKGTPRSLDKLYPDRSYKKPIFNFISANNVGDNPAWMKLQDKLKSIKQSTFVNPYDKRNRISPILKNNFVSPGILTKRREAALKRRNNSKYQYDHKTRKLVLKRDHDNERLKEINRFALIRNAVTSKYGENSKEFKDLAAKEYNRHLIATEKLKLFTYYQPGVLAIKPGWISPKIWNSVTQRYIPKNKHGEIIRDKSTPVYKRRLTGPVFKPVFKSVVVKSALKKRKNIPRRVFNGVDDLYLNPNARGLPRPAGIKRIVLGSKARRAWLEGDIIKKKKKEKERKKKEIIQDKIIASASGNVGAINRKSDNITTGRACKYTDFVHELFKDLDNKKVANKIPLAPVIPKPKLLRRVKRTKLKRTIDKMFKKRALLPF